MNYMQRFGINEKGLIAGTFRNISDSTATLSIAGTPAFKVSGYDTSETAPNRPFLVNNGGVSSDGDVYSCGNQSWDAWHRMEVHGALSDPGGTANGTVDFAIDGAHSPGLPSNSEVTRASGITDDWNIFMLGTGLTYPTKTCREYIDTVYLDDDQARVEICEGSTWSNRGMCEIQKWTSWSETSLTITVNQGGHSNGTAYLFVVDENGAVSDGKPVTIGGGTSDTNTTPTAQAQSVSVTENSIDNTITLTGSGADGDSLTFKVTSSPAKGALSGKAPNLYYTPNTDYSGSDNFTFVVNDGPLASAEAVVVITVQAAGASGSGVNDIGNGDNGTTGGCFIATTGGWNY